MKNKNTKRSLKERFVSDTYGNINPLLNYNDGIIKVLIGFNALELFGAFITGGDWGSIVLTNLLFLCVFLYFNKLKKEFQMLSSTNRSLGNFSEYQFKGNYNRCCNFPNYMVKNNHITSLNNNIKSNSEFCS